MLSAYRPSRVLARILLLGFAGWTTGCATPASSRVVWTSEEWSQEGFSGRRISTAHFEIISTLRDAEFEAGLPEFVEAAYRRYQDTIPSTSAAQPKLAMYVFGTRPEWKRFTQRHFPVRYPLYARIRSGGFTEGEISVSFYTNRAATLATLAHEGWHQYVGRHFGAPLPAWLNEGLACYHEAVEYSNGEPRFTPQRNTFRITHLREAVQNDTLLSLPELVATDSGRIISRGHGPLTQAYYAQAWALITFLRHGAGGRHADAFDQLLGDLANDTFRVRLSAARLERGGSSDLGLGKAAFRAYFGCPSAALADEYYSHLIDVAGL